MNKLLMLSALILAQNLLAEDLLITHDTYLKSTKAQSSELSAQQKCELPTNTLISVDTLQVDGNHFQVELQNEPQDCGLTSGYLYQPHVTRATKLITITQPTVFKQQRVDSSQLPADQKCDVMPGVYAAQSDIASAQQGHYALNLRSFTPNCHFSAGYFWEGHAQLGAMAVQVTGETYFKKQPLQSSQLPASDKCTMLPALYILGTDATTAGDTHYQVTLAATLPGCNFQTGYVYFDHTHLKQPYVEPPAPQWSFPLPGGYYTSGWCQCRNIGTSPHIGQDISRAGTKKAVAVQKGRVTSTSFSSSCGYISYVEDDFGTLWRYVHLNRPALNDGARVQAGQHLAYISQYPKSGCGSGAHLHFERRSAGYFNDRSTGKSCQNGYRSCYYDPIKPWRSNFSQNKVGQAVATGAANWQETLNLKPRQCKVAVTDLAAVKRARLAQYPVKQDNQVSVTFAKQLRSNAPNVLVASAQINNNEANLCHGQRCLTQWQLVAEQASGELTSIFFHNRVRNIALVRLAEEQFCLPNDVMRYWMLLKDNNGQQWRIEIAE
ncbi:MAG: M23 family metallopeptidase [Gammaproteobacteria bacterium]|nr:M23 family metallopeptidase [Gammaproteobacteria bacterium]